MTPVETNKAEALPIILKAFQDKTLQCFHDTGGCCTYRSPDGFPCAVGAVIPAEHDIVEYLNDSPVMLLVREGHVVIPESDHGWFEDLQDLHDTAVRERKMFGPEHPHFAESLKDLEQHLVAG